MAPRGKAAPQGGTAAAPSASHPCRRRSPRTAPCANPCSGPGTGTDLSVRDTSNRLPAYPFRVWTALAPLVPWPGAFGSRNVVLVYRTTATKMAEQDPLPLGWRPCLEFPLMDFEEPRSASSTRFRQPRCEIPDPPAPALRFGGLAPISRF